MFGFVTANMGELTPEQRDRYTAVYCGICRNIRSGSSNLCRCCLSYDVALLALVLIPGLYYTYTGSLGVSADWFNVTIFFITAAAVFYMETKQMLKGSACRLPEWAALMCLVCLGGLFVYFTFAPLRIPLFQDPITGTYGFGQQ